MSILRDCPNQPSSKTNPVIDEFAGSQGGFGSPELANTVTVQDDPVAPDCDANMSTNSLEDGTRTPDGPSVVDSSPGRGIGNHGPLLNLEPEDRDGPPDGCLPEGADSVGEAPQDSTPRPSDVGGHVFEGHAPAAVPNLASQDSEPSPSGMTPDLNAGASGGEPPNEEPPRNEESGNGGLIVQTLSVHTSFVGRIIGKRGQTITDIQQRSGARVDIPQSCESGSPHRHIKIEGTPEQVEFCSVLLRLQLPNQTELEIQHLQMEMASLQARYTGAPSAIPTLQVVEVPMNIVGRIIGRHGQYLRHLKAETGATVTLPRLSMQGTPHSNQIFAVMGNADEVQRCVSILMSKVQECMTPSPQGTPGRRSREYHGAGEGNAAVSTPPGDIRGDGRQRSSFLIVEVPKEHVGRVIGKNGAAIRELQRATGAKVHLPGESDSPYREMQIHGTLEQRQQCYALLISKVPYLEQEPSRVVLSSPNREGSTGGWTPVGSRRYASTGIHSPHMRATHMAQPHQPVTFSHPVYDRMGYDGYMASGMGMYQTHGMMYQPMLPAHLYQEQPYPHSMPPTHGYEVHQSALPPQHQFDWAHTHPPLYHQADPDMVLMHSPGHGAILVPMQQSSPMPTAAPGTPTVDNTTDEGTLSPSHNEQQQQRTQEVAWGTLPEGDEESAWPVPNVKP